ncbi:2-dehydro-3-deoxygalactonokinase [Herbaspirillum sp. Sphag1AN]|uniref:2-dehydro-3-deoxygalactonokinase n=1 Tax=unclassified Herbaspirillum TaxID=2624150 RepID=UPI0016221C3A|nr:MULTISPECIES: 2-dehydro-3-deoxygalactonokinase [unclassified Herbaspirillum]MBB3214861.1 2-dehydro-3-deoxygalactonokinase [Herbaspirillum sp. Sphag1AN]MBB3248055.1 2-dehydro-3-deoxygalactonokinase [Herbaspirillum sp. Sphag64]
MTSSSTAVPTALLALDWGTSSLRAYRFGQDGALLDKRALPWGVMQLPPAPSGVVDSDPAAGFRRALVAACGDWLEQYPGVAVIAAGMVGSKQGWREAPYLEAPLDIDAIGTTLTRIDTGLGITLHIVPGLLQRTALPNVMRGEETQVAGIVDQLQSDDLLIGLPGTHSKWVHVHQRRIAHFDTFMTGEMYAALVGHTILGRTMELDAPAEEQRDDNAFLRGAAVAQSADGRAGLLSNIFSSRTLGLTGELSPYAQSEYLSGLLIGHEIAAMLALRSRMTGASPSAQIALVGDEKLCRRYQRALTLYGIADARLAASATEHGLWKLAHHAGLLG